MHPPPCTRALFALVLAVAPFCGYASQASDYLAGQADADGVIQSETPLATDFQATAAAIEAFAADAPETDPSQTALSYLRGQSAGTTARLARLILAEARLGTVARERATDLLDRQGPDGGFGDRAGDAPNPLDTALALRALAAVEVDIEGLDDAGERAASYLSDRQTDAGGWALAGNEPSVYVTAQVMRGLQPLRRFSQVGAALDAGKSFLLDARDASGSVGAPFETAAAILAVARRAESKSVYTDMVEALEAAQASSGAFADDAFTTALAVQALALFAQPQPNPDLGTIRLKVIDGETDAPLPDAEVSVSGPETLTRNPDADGNVSFRGIPAGSYRIDITRSDYSPVMVDTVLSGGGVKDLGDIGLLKSNDRSTATLRGTVTASETGEPIPGAEIDISGAVEASVTTDSDGRFRLEELSAGSATVTVSADGFETITRSLTLESGVVSVFSVGLDAVEPPAFAVAGTVTAADTGEPLAGASVTVSGAASASTTTGSDGSYSLSGLIPGEITVTAEASGFQPATASTTAQDGQQIDFSPALVAEGEDMDPPSRGGVRGTVIDAATGDPLEGASAELSVDGSTFTTTTDASGAFEFVDVPAGSATLSLSLDGHEPQELSFQIEAGITVDVGEVELTPEGSREPATPQATASGTVVDSLSGEPVEGARLEVDIGGWVTVQLKGSYEEPVVVAGPVTHNNDLALSVRVREVTSTSFQIGVQSPCEIAGEFKGSGDCPPADWESETIRYLVVEAGAWQLADGTKIEAHRTATRAVRSNGGISGEPAVEEFAHDYSRIPAVLHTVNTDNDPGWITSAVWRGDSSPQFAPSTESVSLALEGAEITPVHGQETIGWVVIERGRGSLGDRSYNAGSSFNAVQGHDTCLDQFIGEFDEPPELVASQVSMEGGNGSWLRLCGSGATTGQFHAHAEEDQVGDSERGHTSEAIAWFAIESAGVGQLTAADGSTAQFEVGSQAVTETAKTLTVMTDASGAFAFEAPAEVQGSMTVSAEGFQTTGVPVFLRPGANDLGTIRIRPEGVEEGLPDLVAREVRGDGTRTMGDPPRYEGNIEVEITNEGPVDVDQPFELRAFVDLDGDGQLGPGDTTLGNTTVDTAIPDRGQQTIALDVAGPAPFQDAPITVVADKAGDIPELNESNNTTSTAAECRVQPPPAADLNPELKWKTRGVFNGHEHPTASGPMAVGQFSDDNGDGEIDQQDIPDVVAPLGAGGNTDDDTMLAVYSGDDGSLIWARHDVSVSNRSTPAIGDVDGDGFYEIAVINFTGDRLMLFEHDGTLAWDVSSTKPDRFSKSASHAPLIVNLDQSGQPEIVVGNAAFDHQGNLLWKGSQDSASPRGPDWGSVPVAADLHPSPGTEVSAGRTLYGADGAVLWHRADLPRDGTTGIGDFDDDSRAEIVLVTEGRVILLEHTGETIWNVPLGTEGPGGPPTVADFDADEKPEVGVAGGRRYVVFETDGSVKWTVPNEDTSSRATGSSLFDFDADGRAEVLYADEREFRIFSGETGDTLFAIQNASITKVEYPIVADVDNDRGAEIVIASNPRFSREVDGLRVFEAANGQWAPTRSVWNQHSYHINNINDDGSIPKKEEPSWQSHNTYRLNTFVDQDPLTAPDLSASLLEIVDSGEGRPVTLRVRIGNAGAFETPGEAEVTFYDGDPKGGGTVLGTVGVDALAPGEWQDVTLDGVALNELSGADLFAEVDSGDSLDECREDNNLARTPPETVASLGEVSVSTDRSTYPAGVTVTATASGTNRSSFAGEFAVAMRVVDAGGSLVADLGTASLGSLAPAESATTDVTWPVGGTLAGGYRVRATLVGPDGDELDTATTAFRIAATDDDGNTVDDPAKLVTLRTTSDRAEYHVDDSVTIDNLVRNLARNARVSDAAVQVNVTAPNDETVFEGSAPISTLAAGGQLERRLGFTLDGAARGEYVVSGQVRASDGSLLAEAGDSFRVINDLARALTGEVEVATGELFVGEAQTCMHTIENTSPVPAPGLETRVRVADLANETLVRERRRTIDLAGESANSFAEGFDTGGLDTGIHSCILQARIDGEWQTLASAGFELKVPPIELAGRFEARERGRLLVLVDPARPGENCRGPRSIDLAPEGWNFGPGREVALRLHGRWGYRVLDAERVTGAVDETVDRSPGRRGVNLSVRAGEDGEPRVRIAAAEGRLDDAHRITVRIRAGNGRDHHVSRRIEADCSWGAHAGRIFRVAAVDWDAEARDPFGPKGAPALGEQRDHLEQVLADAGWNARIVSSADAFAEGLRSGGFEAYALFNERVKLPYAVQKELRAAVFRGEGLLFAGPHDARNRIVFDTAGVELRGRQPFAGGLDFTDSPVGEADEAVSFGQVERPLRVCPEDAEVAGRYQLDRPDRHHGFRPHADKAPASGGRSARKRSGGTDPQGFFGLPGFGRQACGHGHFGRPWWLGHHKNKAPDPAALTTAALGEGRSVFAGFDALVEAAAAPGGRFQHLITDALDWSHPDPVEPIGGSVRGFTIVAENLRQPTPGRVRVTLPDALEIVDAGGAEIDAQGRLVWPFDLGRQESFRRTFWVRLPRGADSVTLAAQIQSSAMDSDEFVTRAEAKRTIEVVDLPGLDEARSAAKDGGLPMFIVRKKLALAARWLERDRIELAHHALLKADSLLARIDTQAADEVRLPLTRAIGEVSGRLE